MPYYAPRGRSIGVRTRTTKIGISMSCQRISGRAVTKFRSAVVPTATALCVTLVLACAAATAPPITRPPPILPLLEVIAEPREAADFLLNPRALGSGGYPMGMTVTIDVLPKDGWEVDEWVGPVYAVIGKSAQIDMDAGQTVVVRLVRTKAPTAASTLLPSPTSVTTPRPAPVATLVPKATFTPVPTPTPTPLPSLTSQEVMELVRNVVSPCKDSLDEAYGASTTAVYQSRYMGQQKWQVDVRWSLGDLTLGTWDVDESREQVSPSNEDAATVLEAITSGGCTLPPDITPLRTPTPAATPTPTPRPTISPTPTPLFSKMGAETFLYRTIGECVRSLEAAYGAPLPVSYHSRYRGGELWLVEAWSHKIGVSYGIWEVRARPRTVKPSDSIAHVTQKLIFEGRGCGLPVGVESLIPPTPTPAPPPTPIPFMCRSPEGVTVTEISGNIGNYGIGLDISARLTNTCNEPMTVVPTAVAFRPNRTILKAKKDYLLSGLCLNPGQSQVITTHLTGTNYSNTNVGSVNIEVEVSRVTSCR